MPRLFIVATPIGNLSDISARALQTLRDCDLIAAEDTRVTRALLNHFEINTPCVSNHQHNEENRAAPIVARMLEEDLDVALVTDAGTPCISDPGSFLAKEAAAAGIEVLAVPGPTAMASALSVSGFDTREFAFYGFARTGVPIAVAHESPHRVIDLVSVICETLPGCRISASCDLTKLHEKTIRGTAEEVLAMLRANEKAEKGEYCLVLDLHDVHVEERKAAYDTSLEARIFELLMAGRDMREAGDALMQQGEKRNDVYRARTAVQKFLEELWEDDDDEE